jgi:hypothetical protein
MTASEIAALRWKRKQSRVETRRLLAMFDDPTYMECMVKALGKRRVEEIIQAGVATLRDLDRY